MSALTEKQKIIRDILVCCARRRRTITYGALGLEDNVGRTARGPWTTDLGAIRDEEVKAGRPDISLTVVSQTTHLPRMYRGKELDPNDKKRVKIYKRDLDRIYEYWEKNG